MWGATWILQFISYQWARERVTIVSFSLQMGKESQGQFLNWPGSLSISGRPRLWLSLVCPALELLTADQTLRRGSECQEGFSKIGCNIFSFVLLSAWCRSAALRCNMQLPSQCQEFQWAYEYSPSRKEGSSVPELKITVATNRPQGLQGFWHYASNVFKVPHCLLLRNLTLGQMF